MYLKILDSPTELAIWLILEMVGADRRPPIGAPGRGGGKRLRKLGEGILHGNTYTSIPTLRLPR